MAAVTVLVPTIGRPAQLEGCLASLAAGDERPAEVLVVDQSEGPQIAALCARFGACRVASQPAGLGRAMNAGLAAAEHDVVLGTHDDCTVQRDWVATGARLALAYPGAIVTGRVLPASDAAHVPSCITDPRARDYTGRLRVDKLYPASMVVPRREVLEIGGFDERFESAAEDNDLCYRWLRGGRSLRYEPALTVVHHDWRPTEELAGLYRRYGRAAGLFYGKHLRGGDLRILPWVLRDLAAGAVGAAASAVAPRRPADWKTGLLVSVTRGMRDAWR